MLWSNGAAAAIVINDVELPRYKIEHDNASKTVTCWIPSEAGKAFSVKWGSGLRYHSMDTSARIWIDGMPGDGMISNSCTCYEPFHIHSINCVTVSSTTACPMLFSVVDYTDKQDSEVLEDASKNLGEIVLTIHETTLIRNTAFYNPGVATGNRSLNEREKKLVAHRICLGEEMLIPLQNQSWCDTRDIRLVATFIFKYRPLDLLIAEGIAPRNLLKRTIVSGNNDDDSGVEDTMRLQTIHKSIMLLDRKIAEKNYTPTPILKAGLPIVGDARDADDDGYDSEMEQDQAKLHSLNAAARLLHNKLNQTGESPMKKVKLTYPPEGDH